MKNKYLLMSVVVLLSPNLVYSMDKKRGKEAACRNSTSKRDVDVQAELIDAFNEFEEATSKLRRVMMKKILLGRAPIDVSQDDDVLQSEIVPVAPEAFLAGNDLDERGAAACGRQVGCVLSACDAQEHSDEQEAAQLLLQASGDDLAAAGNILEELEKEGGQMSESDDASLACAPLANVKAVETAIAIPQAERASAVQIVPDENFIQRWWSGPALVDVLPHVNNVRSGAPTASESCDYMRSGRGVYRIGKALQELMEAWDKECAERSFNSNIEWAKESHAKLYFDKPEKYQSASLAQIEEILGIVREYNLAINPVIVSMLVQKIKQCKAHSIASLDSTYKVVSDGAKRQLEAIKKVRSERDKQFAQLLEALSLDK